MAETNIPYGRRRGNMAAARAAMPAAGRRPCVPCGKKKSLRPLTPNESRMIQMRNRMTAARSSATSAPAASLSRGQGASMSAPMSRGSFLRTAGLGAAALGAAGGLGGVASAVGGDEPWDNKIYPTGDAAQDWQNLQDAVNRGGTVRLMSDRGMHFNLVGHTVSVRRDVAIIGQGTKIKYGNVPAFSCSSAVKLSMRNLKFMDLGRESISPLDAKKPASGIIQLDTSSLAIGGDEPWE